MPDQVKIRLKEQNTGISSGRPKIDRKNGVIYNVKVLGKKSRNGAQYTEQAVKQAHRDKIYENSVVYLNHNYDESRPGRQLHERFGRLKNLYVKEQELFAKEFRFNPHHPIAESFLWFVENDPEGVGLSHDADAIGYMAPNETKVIEQITKVRSVDLVDGPATTYSLLEQYKEKAMPKKTYSKVREQDDMTAPVLDDAAPPAADAGTGDHEEHLVNAIQELAASVKDGTIDKEECRKKIMAILDLIGDEAGDDPEDTELEEPAKVVEQLRAIPLSATRRAAKLIHNSIQAQVFEQRISKARKYLPMNAITEQFRKQLRKAESDDEVTELIEDRKRFAVSAPQSNPRTIKITSREQDQDGYEESLSSDKIKELSRKVFDFSDDE